MMQGLAVAVLIYLPQASVKFGEIVLHYALNMRVNEQAEKRSEYALLITMVVVAVTAILFVIGPQVAIVASHAAGSG